MATERLAMHQAREILRQKLTLKRSHRDVMATVGVSMGTVSGVVVRAVALGLDWGAVEALDDEALEARLIDVNYSCRSATTISAGSGHVLPLVHGPHLHHPLRVVVVTSAVVVVVRHSIAPTPSRPRALRLVVMPRPVERGAITEHRGPFFHRRAPSRPGAPSCAHASETSLLAMVATRARLRGPPLTRCRPSSSSTRCASWPPPPARSPGRSR